MDFNRIKNAATKIWFPTIDKDNPESYLTTTTPTITAYYVDAWGTEQSHSIAATPIQLGSTGLWGLAITGPEGNHDIVLIKISGTGIVEDTLTIYYDSIKSQSNNALVAYPVATLAEVLSQCTAALTSYDVATVGDVPTTADIVAALLSAEGMTGVLQDLSTLVESDMVVISRGDNKRLTFALGSGWDLTSKKTYFCMKDRPTDSNANAVVNREITVTDAVNGAGYIDLDPDTESSIAGDYYAEIEIRDLADENPNTALRFKIQIAQDVRQ